MVCSQGSFGQTRSNDSLVLSSADSLTIIDLLDSLLSVEKEKSDLILKMSYISKIATAGRDLGMEQYGLAPGISYYHPIGIFGDVTGYWNSEMDPQYQMTITSLGYMFFIKNKISNLVSYDHTFFNGEAGTLNNSLNLSSQVNFNFIDVGFDYSYLFGEASAHRLNGVVSGYFKIKDIPLFDRITFMPSVSVLWGNANIISFRFNRDQIERYLIYLRQFRPVVRRAILRRLVEENNVFGLMNYNFSLPVRVSWGHFSFLFTYNYNIPVALPGERLTYPEFSYFNISTYYTLSF